MYITVPQLWSIAPPPILPPLSLIGSLPSDILCSHPSLSESSAALSGVWMQTQYLVVVAHGPWGC